MDNGLNFCSQFKPAFAFERVEQLNLLPILISRLYIPPAVRREVFGSKPLPEWVEEKALSQPLASKIMAARLGAGEREAIALALELKATRLIIDDLSARRLATSLGLEVIGTLGLLLRAKRQELIPDVRPLMEALQSQDFRISEKLFAGILAAAGEN